MPYVVKHKQRDRFINGSGTKAAHEDCAKDANYLASLEYAQTYATPKGAKIALRSWATMWDNNAGTLNPAGIPWGGLVLDQAKYDMMEIVEVKVTL